jgi:hypothetical protein
MAIAEQAREIAKFLAAAANEKIQKETREERPKVPPKFLATTRRATSFKDAFDSIPACVVIDPAQVNTIADVRYVLQHEIDLFEEGQDGALTAGEINQVIRALARVS